MLRPVLGLRTPICRGGSSLVAQRRPVPLRVPPARLLCSTAADKSKEERSASEAVESPTPPLPAPSLAAGTWPHILSKKAITIDDPDRFPRWLMPVAGACVHVSIGSVYAWSIWNGPLTRQLGVVAQAAGDWSFGDALGVFSCTAVSLGVTTFVLGPWQARSALLRTRHHHTCKPTTIVVSPDHHVAHDHWRHDRNGRARAWSHSQWRRRMRPPSSSRGSAPSSTRSRSCTLVIASPTELLPWSALPPPASATTGRLVASRGRYAGYGVLGGLAWGLGYLSPVSTLMRWFPERKGLAAGLALTCFGMGAAVGAPLINALLERHFVPPTYLGQAAEVATALRDGVAYAEHGGRSVEVVVATAADVARLPGALAEGVYVVGTGDTGVAASMFTLAGLYYAAISLGALTVRVPREGWWPAGAPRSGEEAALATAPSVDYNAALRTAQFPLFFGLVSFTTLTLAVAVAVAVALALPWPKLVPNPTEVMGNAFAGMILISSAKTLMTDIFAAAMPATVTSSFAAGSARPRPRAACPPLRCDLPRSPRQVRLVPRPRQLSGPCRLGLRLGLPRLEEHVLRLRPGHPHRWLGPSHRAAGAPPSHPHTTYPPFPPLTTHGLLRTSLLSPARARAAFRPVAPSTLLTTPQVSTGGGADLAPLYFFYGGTLGTPPILDPPHR